MKVLSNSVYDRMVETEDSMRQELKTKDLRISALEMELELLRRDIKYYQQQSVRATEAEQAAHAKQKLYKEEYKLNIEKAAQDIRSLVTFIEGLQGKMVSCDNESCPIRIKK